MEAEAGSGPFSVEAEARKSYRFHIGYLTWRVTWRKILFISQCGFKWRSCTISLNERAISVARENEIKHN